MQPHTQHILLWWLIRPSVIYDLCKYYLMIWSIIEVEIKNSIFDIDLLCNLNLRTTNFHIDYCTRRNVLLYWTFMQIIIKIPSLGNDILRGNLNSFFTSDLSVRPWSLYIKTQTSALYKTYGLIAVNIDAKYKKNIISNK